MAGVQILDAVTLKQLKFFTPPLRHTQLLTFSPENRLLTWAGITTVAFVSWDIQTGVPTSEIPTIDNEPTLNAYSITYSGCGMMFGVMFKGTITTIETYDILSGTPIHRRQVDRPGIGMIWTHGKCLQFATLEPESLTIWEVEFASKGPRTEVGSLCIPKNFNPSEEFFFLPTLSRLAFILEGRVLVWDAQNSKVLLHTEDAKTHRGMSFSSDGHFFACGTGGPEIYLWKESPTGYTLHQKLISSSMGFCKPLLSPDGQSIVASGTSILQLWYTTDSTTTPSPPTQSFQPTEYFILGFSPGGSFAVAARLMDNTAIVLHLKPSFTQLIIDTGMEIFGLAVTGNTVIVVGNEKIITWKLPAGDHLHNTSVNVTDSIQTIMLNRPRSLRLLHMYSASISPDFNYVAIAEKTVGGEETEHLNIYRVSTGDHHAGTFSQGSMPWFDPNGYGVWCHSVYGGVEGWAIVGDGIFKPANLERLDPAKGPLGGFPWRSSYGYQITDDGWILSPSGKRLLWLPHHWRSDKRHRTWCGQFLGLSHHELPEVIILELPEE